MRSFYNEWIRIPIRNFIIGLKNLIKWLPIIWKDRDWDKHFIMEILIFKLKQNRRYIAEHGHLANGEEVIRSMTECIDLLEMVHDEWTHYEEPAYKKHEEKWGSVDFYTEPLPENPELHVLKDRNDERYTEKQIKEKNREFIIASRIARQKRQKDFDLAMQIFSNKFDTWWD